MTLSEIQLVVADMGFPEWTAVLTAASTLVLAFLTGWYVHLTGKLLSAQTDPLVTLTLTRSDRGIVSFVLQNHGRTPAVDVTIELPTEFRVHDFSQKRGADGFGPLEDGPVGAGVPVIVPGQVVAQLWAQEGRLWERFGDKTGEVVIRWRQADGKTGCTKHRFGISMLDPRRLTHEERS